MKVKDINFLKESIRQIECEVIKPKIGKYEEIKEKFKKDGVIEVSDKKGEYLYIHNELSISFKIVDKNQKNKLDLKPVLSLKARVTSVKEINKDDSVSYGRTYIADSNRKIASISIGYADGFPRCLSNKNMLVKVNGNYSKVIGRICMDQCVIDVTDVKEIKTGDVVYIIDCDDINLSSEKFAMNADTITNEFLSRLGNRLPRIRS